MNYGELQTYLSQKLGTTETINFKEVERKQALNDALLNDVQEWTKWRELIVKKPLTFLRRGRLICGVTPKTTYTDWTSITNGSFRIGIDGTDYNVDGITFAAATDMDSVATILQTAIRTATSGSETVNYYTDYFVISSGTTGDSSAVTVLSTSTGTVGTDISDTSYLNGVTAFTTTYSTCAIPSNYREMVMLYLPNTEGTLDTEYSYISPESYNTSTSYVWTKQDLFGTDTFFVTGNDDVNLIGEYRKKLVAMSASADTTGLGTGFDEAIVLIAATKLLSHKNPNDNRIRVYIQQYTNLLDGMYKKTIETSERNIRKISDRKIMKNTYSY